MFQKHLPAFASGVLTVLLAGCASTRITAFKDPEFAGRVFAKPAILAHTSDLDWRRSLEETMVLKLSKLGIGAQPTLELMPPTREYSPEEQTQILTDSGADVLIVIQVGESGVRQQYVPPTGMTTTTYQGTSTTTVIGGYNVHKPWAQLTTRLVEVVTGRVVWVASSFTHGNAFASFEDIRDSYCQRIVQEMAVNRLFLQSTAPPTLGGYSVDVNTVPGFTKRIHSVAIAPGTCPQGVDCIWLEDRLRDEVAAFRGQGIMFAQSARQVREKMFELGIETVDADSRANLAERLGLDAFVVPVVQFSGTKSTGAVGIVTGPVFGVVQSEIAKGAAQLLVIDARTGEVLVKGIAYADSGWKGEKGVLLKMFKRILQQAFAKQ